MFRLILLLMSIIYTSGAYSTNCYDWQADKSSDEVYRVNLIGIGAVTIWGVINWDYFSRSVHAQSEGWFGAETDNGGADKLGHFYSSYVTARGVSAYFENHCLAPDDAAFYGALSSFLIMGYMEIGDSFSDYGFSHEDFISNSLGSLAGYYLYKYPDLARKLDIRWEYGFHPTRKDFVTDYENSKYLLAIKLNGFESIRNSFLKHIELHFGYYGRGFDDPSVSDERNLYVGLGLNLTDLFRRSGYDKTAVFLNYYQVPGSYITTENDLNK